MTDWLLGDDAEEYMNALTAPKDQTPAEKWLPLEEHRECEGGGLDDYRSAYGFRPGPGGQPWVDFASRRRSWWTPSGRGHSPRRRHWPQAAHRAQPLSTVPASGW